MDLGLRDATAVVVGGGRGMGLAAARCLADDGARVAVVGRTRSVLDEAVADLTRRGSPDAVGLVADATDAGQVQRLFDEIGQRWNGELNIVINAAGPGAAAFGAVVVLTMLASKSFDPRLIWDPVETSHDS